MQVCQADRTFGACQCSSTDSGIDAAVDPTDTGTGTPDTGASTSDTGASTSDTTVVVDGVASEIGAVDTGPLDAGSAPDAGSPVDAGADVPPDGCLSTAVGNCCGVACPAAAHASPVCGGGACTVACTAGYASCDGTLANGCEVELATSDAHCGACGTACTMGRRCVGGTCQCPTGQALCDGRCVDFQTDVRHCGACGTPCAEGRVCAAGACVPCPSAVFPLTACGGQCVNARIDAAHCGGCGRACPEGQSCAAGACVPAVWEDFDTGEWPRPPWEVARGTDGFTVSASCAHDGARGLSAAPTTSGAPYRLDRLVGVPGQRLSVWLRTADANSVAILGLSSVYAGTFFVSLARGASSRFEMVFGRRPEWTQITTETIARTTADVTPGVWYRLEVQLGAAGMVTARLTHPTGTIVGTLSAAMSTNTGGAALFGTGTCFDTLELR